MELLLTMLLTPGHLLAICGLQVQSGGIVHGKLIVVLEARQLTVGSGWTLTPDFQLLGPVLNGPLIQKRIPTSRGTFRYGARLIRALPTSDAEEATCRAAKMAKDAHSTGCSFFGKQETEQLEGGQVIDPSSSEDSSGGRRCVQMTSSSDPYSLVHGHACTSEMPFMGPAVDADDFLL
ncbi:hypothetical protein TREES_T100016651 [Tupaia chinensis]|uniref:Uncharacterized protein n=1 Tax=Tupaia chinensis TaxID=246437 RepID=L9L712_TUPCH|nr:hypothetical protein TREES_T100016651 [Tupaia chinensis]